MIMMIKALYIFSCALFVGGLLYHFAALKVFNFVVPKDAGSELIACSIAYGDDPQQQLDIYKPKQVHGPLPILIFVHGGSWKDGDRADYEFAGRAFAARGYLTLVMSYRMLPKNAYPDFVADVALAIKWATLHGAEYGGDVKNIFAVGHSAGAYNIALAILDEHYLKDAGVDPSVIKGVVTLAGPFDFVPLDSPITIATFGHLKDLVATQPITYARADAPPFLLLHGTADTTVKPRNSKSLFKHLIDAGAHPKLIEYQDVSHVGIMLDVAKPLRAHAPVLEDVVSFFKDISK
jgi:acetyl esterase/lipase